jgi:hypothetical protein
MRIAITEHMFQQVVEESNLARQVLEARLRPSARPINGDEERRDVD